MRPQLGTDQWYANLADNPRRGASRITDLGKGGLPTTFPACALGDTCLEGDHMGDNGIAYTDSLDWTATQLFEDQGYVVVRGLLDYAEDIRPVREEYGALLESLAYRWHREGKLSSTYDDLPFEQRLAMVASEGVRYTDYFDITFTGKEGHMHRGLPCSISCEAPD